MAEKAPVEPFVAVDIGSFSLKFAYVVPSPDKPILKTLSHMRIPPFTHMLTADEREKMSREDVEKDALVKLQKFLTKHLTELLYDNQIQTKKAIFLASGRAVTIRYVEIPPVPEKEAFAAAVNAEAGKQMPFCMEKAVLGFSVLGDTVREEKAFTQLMIAALQKDIVPIVSESLKGGGLTLEGIMTLPQSLELGLPLQLKPPEGKESKVAVIHCGHKATSIMVYKNGVLHFYRDINMAGETITEAIFAGGEVDGAQVEFKQIEEAIDLKHRIGVLPPDEIKNLKGAEKLAAQQIFNNVEKIFQHIQLSISFYISQFQESGVEKLILCGGSASMKNFKEFIQESLEVPVEIANPFGHLSMSEINVPKNQMDEEAPSFAPAIGLALYKEDPKVINFVDILYPNRKKQAMAFSDVSSKFSKGIGQRFKIQLSESQIKALAGLIGVLLLLIIVYPFVKIRQDVTAAIAEQKKLQKNFDELTNTQNDVTQLLADKDRLGKEALFVDELRNFQFPHSDMLLELASITPKEIFFVNITFNKDGNRRTFRIVGQADNSDRIFEYVKIFGSSQFFKTPSIESTEEVAIDEKRYFMNFVITGVIQAPAPPTEGGG